MPGQGVVRLHRADHTAALPGGTDVPRVIAAILHVSLPKNWTSSSRFPNWQPSREPGPQETSLPLVGARTFVNSPSLGPVGGRRPLEVGRVDCKPQRVLEQKSCRPRPVVLVGPPAPGRGGSPREKGEVGVRVAKEQGPQGVQGTVRLTTERAALCGALAAVGAWVKWPNFILALQPPLNQVPLSGSGPGRSPSERPATSGSHGSCCPCATAESSPGRLSSWNGGAAVGGAGGGLASPAAPAQTPSRDLGPSPRTPL